MTTRELHVRVLYFASAREEIGLREETVAVPADTRSLGALRALLCAKYPAAEATISVITLARNLEYSSDEVELVDGDEVALIPPISGG